MPNPFIEVVKPNAFLSAETVCQMEAVWDRAIEACLDATRQTQYKKKEPNAEEIRENIVALMSTKERLKK